MRYLRNMPIRRKLTLMLTLVSSLVLLLAGAAVAVHEAVARTKSVATDSRLSHYALLKNALSAKDFHGTTHLAHALRGTSANLGAKRFAALCGRLEMSANKGSLDGADGLLFQLEKELDSVRGALETEKEKLLLPA